MTQPEGCDLPLPSPPPVSYRTDIAPLLQAKCVVCHSPGNIGPFAMTSYEAVYAYRLSIREAVSMGHMPPWHADPEHGRFANDNSLKPADLAKLVPWIDQGAPRGEGPDPLSEAPAPSLADYPFTKENTRS
jgi:mono/diheme cytochrome c family protein